MTIGIYSIRNLINNKRYIGKSINIEKRYLQHLYLLKKDFCSKDCNRHLYRAVKKYGIDNFELEILETFEIPNENIMKDSELKWMDIFLTCDRKYGYNLRRDSSTKTEVSNETRELLSLSMRGDKNPNYGNNWTDEMKVRMSTIKKKQHMSGEIYGEEFRRKQSESSKSRWKNSELKESVSRKISILKNEYRFYQYDRNWELIKVWETMKDIVDETGFHSKSIYACCSGHKKSYRNFYWKKELKI